MKSTMKPWAILALILCTAMARAWAAPPAGIQPFSADYALGNGSVTVGTVGMSLSQAGERWRFQSSSKATGVFALLRSDRTTETSWLANDADRIRPLAYEFEQSGSREKTVKTTFDWDSGEATTQTSDQKTSQQALQPGTQDRLSVVLRLVAAAREDRRELSVDVNEKGRERVWSFTQAGRETIRTEAGLYEAIKMVQAHDQGDRYTIAWLAPALGYLPVRLDQYKDRKLKVRMDLRRLDGPAATTASNQTGASRD